MLPEPAQRISRAAVWHWTVSYLLGTAVLGAVATAAVLLVPLRSPVRTDVLVVTAFVVLGCVALAVVIPRWRYAVHRWETHTGNPGGDVVLTRAGVLFRDWRIVPLSRVQTVEVSQTVLERVFGVARLQVRTASYAGSTDIAGLDATLARELAETLTAALISNDDGA